MTGSVSCQYKYKYNTNAQYKYEAGSWIFSPVPTERGDLDRKYLDRLLHLPLSSSPPILTHWYTWCKSALAVVVHLVHIGTPLTKATLTSTSLQNCYSDTLTQLVPTPNQRELLIDCSAWARQWHIVLCSKIRSYMPEIAPSPRTTSQ